MLVLMTQFLISSQNQYLTDPITNSCESFSGQARKQSAENHTAIFIMVVTPAVLAHDVSVRAGDVWMGITVPLAGFTQCHSKNWETVKLRQRSISIQPIREQLKSLKHVKLRVDT